MAAQRDESDDIRKYATFKNGRRFGDWKIQCKLGEGGFGQVYRVRHINDPKKVAALKAEPNDVEGGSAIKLEIMMIHLLNKSGDNPHVVKLFHAAKHRKFSYMVVTLLGENLKRLKRMCDDEKFTPSTWSRIGIQCLYAIKLLHDIGFVHRDIKPANFVMGHESDPDRARCVHIVDFGLARNFAFQIRRTWVARRARPTAEFRGTVRYCSPSVHDRQEQGRKDDIWSLVYMLIELNYELPWQTEKDKKKVAMIKKEMKDADLMKFFPAEMHAILPHLRTLDCYNRPDYSMIYGCFLKLMKRLDVKYDDKFDWETDSDVADIIKQQTKAPAYEHAEAFFASDPLKINEAPPPGIDKQSRTQEDLELFMRATQHIVRSRSSSKNSKSASHSRRP